jgi:hypothetical protein
MANIPGTNVPAVTFGPNGFQAPPQQDVLNGVFADIDAAFGGGLNPSLSSPQGQLATSLAAIIGSANDDFVNLTNQMNPSFADGRFQDAIAEIYFQFRNGAEPTVVQAICGGGFNVSIPAGSLARAVDGKIYTCTDGGVIPIGGSITLTFACNVLGPVPCPAGSLNEIYRNISGWDTITNLADGVLGSDTETREQFEARRQASVAHNSIGSIPSVQGAVLSVAGILDAYVTENPSSSPATIGGVVLAPNSLYVAAVGGASSDIARAIWTKKSPGCNYNGNTTVTVVDSNSGYSPPLPSYQVTFERPPTLPILFAVTIANNSLVPSNAAALIQGAIISAFAGADGGTRARIGSTIYASRFYAPIAALGSWAQIISLLVGSNNAASAVFVGYVAGSALTVTSVTSGALAIGQTITDALGIAVPGTTITAGSGTSWTTSNSTTIGGTFTGFASGTTLTASAVVGAIAAGQIVVGTGVPGGTTIVTQLTGTPGGAGTYQTNVVTTAAGATLSANDTFTSAKATLNQVTTTINQSPTVNANDVSVAVS